MDLTGAIKSAEYQYKQILEDFFVSVYNKRELPSHGLEHHRRVWNYAKELVILLSEKDQLPEEYLPHKLILAAYLHDIGMVIDHGPQHGIHSLRLCEEFMAKNNIDPGKFPGLLQAIAEHDNKDYQSESKFSLLTILSVADDLDAFGYTGIYRYIEIYASRGIESEEISSRIRSNAHKRYRHFAELFRDYPELVKKHKIKYHILESFFNEYEKKEKSGSAGGYVAIVRMLTGLGFYGNSLERLIQDNASSPDQVVREYFEGLKSEMELNGI